jgi:hypothetical protein
VFSCKECSSTENAHSHTLCEPCFWRKVIGRHCVRLRPLIEAEWARELFDAFVQEWLTKNGVHASDHGRAIKYAGFFNELGQRFPPPTKVTSQRLLEHYSVEQLRRLHVPVAWLMEHGHLPRLADAEVNASVEAAAQARLLGSVEQPWHLELLRRYEQYLHAFQHIWRKRGWYGEHERFTDRTVTLLLRAARRFLESLQEDVTSVHSIARLDLDRFVVEFPGHRNALHSFVNYLNRKESLFQKLRLNKDGQVAGLPAADLLSTEVSKALLQRWLPPQQSLSRRDALLLLFMLVYARNATQACKLRRRDFTVHRDGVVTAKFGRLPVELDADIAGMLRDHLTELEAKRETPLLDEDYVFPGRLPSRHFGTAALQHILGREGVTARQLYTTALADFYRAGLRSPKTLVTTLGIADNTAIIYWQHFSPRLVDEMKYLAGRR